MNRFWKDMGIAIVMGWIVPAILLAAVVSLTKSRTQVPLLTEPIVTVESPEEQETEQGSSILLVDELGQVKQMPLYDYLTCVVLAEMPALFEDEALKAQAVVARTFTMRAATVNAKHPDADVCTDSACCQGYIAVADYLNRGGTQENVERIRKLVSETDGQVLTYEGSLIEATYFSCSGGTTEDAVAVWGTDVPYLRSVISPGEEHAAYYTDSVTFEADEFASKLDIKWENDTDRWFSDVSYTSGGGVASIKIGDKTFTGTQLRKLLGLRSTAFTVMAQDNTITFYTRGYGHRVGMSQYGADAMASRGSTYDQILAYYYQGTELRRDFR